MGSTQPLGTRGDEGALAAVIPAAAEQVKGPAAQARGLLGEGSAAGLPPDVVLAEGSLPPEAFDAPVVVMSIMSTPRLIDGGTRAADAVLRVTAHVLSGSRSALVAHQLRGRGFAHVKVIRWDHRQPFPQAGRSLRELPPWHPHRYPRRAIVLATRSDAEPSVLDASLHAAGVPEPHSVRASEAALVAIGESAVVRVAVGAGRSQVLRPVQICNDLLKAQPDAVLADRMPWVEAHGLTGLGAWSAERRLSGVRAEPPLPPSVLDECRAVLVELFRLGTSDAAPSQTCAADLQRIAGAIPPDAAAAAERLATAADHVLSDVPRGFGHGDFWYENLLVNSGRLTGVIDWDSAGPGRFPLLDLLHLRLSAHRAVPGYRWGSALLDVLMPWADGGADDLGRRYCEDLGLSTRPTVLRALVVAYWLDWLHYQFDRYADRATRSRWIANNVVKVAHALNNAGWSHL